MTTLARYDAARVALQAAQSVDEVKDIRDKAQAMAAYARQAKDTQLVEWATEIKVRAERRAGEMLAEMAERGERDAGKGGDRKSRSHDATVMLAALGVNKSQSSRWQKLAGIPEAEFEQAVAAAKEMAGEVTTAALLRLGRDGHREAQREQNAKLVAPSFPEGQYPTLVIDPPWPIEKITREVRPNQVEVDYPVMSLDEIKGLLVPTLVADNCHLYLWTTQRFLPDAFDCLKCWGVRYIFTMVWLKSGGFQPWGLPQYNCEFILFGRKGDLPFLTTKDFFTCFTGDRREHSRKPSEFYDLVGRVSPGPRLDMFSREAHEGFESWGNEIDKFSR